MDSIARTIGMACRCPDIVRFQQRAILCDFEFVRTITTTSALASFMGYDFCRPELTCAYEVSNSGKSSPLHDCYCKLPAPFVLIAMAFNFDIHLSRIKTVAMHMVRAVAMPTANASAMGLVGFAQWYLSPGPKVVIC